MMAQQAASSARAELALGEFARMREPKKNEKFSNARSWPEAATRVTRSAGPIQTVTDGRSGLGSSLRPGGRPPRDSADPPRY